MPRSHDKDYFFKFMPIETAKIVLETSSLRWAKPSSFNDPFDHQVSLQFPYSAQEFSSALGMEYKKIILDDTINFEQPSKLTQKILALRNNLDNIDKNQLDTQIEESVELVSDNFQVYKDSINSLITKDLNQSRVLCVAEDNTNIVMWSHYADSHKGICLRLQCVDEIDNELLAAKKVTYTDSFPLFMTLEDHVQHLTGQSPACIPTIISSIAFLKHNDWKYENEWRVYRPHESADGNHNDWRIDHRVFGAIYFGCRVDQLVATELMTLIERYYPNMEVYQAVLSNHKFELVYNRVK